MDSLGRSVAVYAQEPENQMPVDLQSPTPATLNGQKPMLNYRTEETQSNFLSGGVNLTSAFTDNKFLSTTDPKSEISYLIQPYVSFPQLRKSGLQHGVRFLCASLAFHATPTLAPSKGCRIAPT